MQPWLRNSIICTVASISLLSLGWWATCSFYIGPKLWNEYVRSNGARPSQEPEVCQDSGARTLQVMTGLLATLISLGSTLDSDR
jgi:hypothetical protein